MATAYIETCSICTEEYDSSHRQSVPLPCGHEFCLSCLVRLRASGKHKCPRCRGRWAGVNLQSLLGMEALAAALKVDQEDEQEDDKKKIKNDRCEKHSMPYDFWVNAKKDFFCRRCAAENKDHVQLEIIEDAIPQIKAALAADVTEASETLQVELKSLDEFHANLVKERNSVKELMKAVKTLDENFDQEIGNVAALRAKKLESSVELKKFERKVSNITSPADLGVAMECKSTLKKIAATSSKMTSDLPEKLLCDIARTYAEQSTARSPPSKASFDRALRKGRKHSDKESSKKKKVASRARETSSSRSRSLSVSDSDDSQSSSSSGSTSGSSSLNESSRRSRSSISSGQTPAGINPFQKVLSARLCEHCQKQLRCEDCDCRDGRYRPRVYGRDRPRV